MVQSFGTRVCQIILYSGTKVSWSTIYFEIFQCIILYPVCMGAMARVLI